MWLDWTNLFLQVQDVLPAVVDEPEKFKPLGGLKFFNGEDLLSLVIRMLLHLSFVFVLVRLIYYPIAKRKDFLFFHDVFLA
jgi:hypothetical protein